MKIIQENKGFTLIEALIAMFVLAIGILGLYTMQITAIKGNSSANNMTRSAVSANDTVEQLMGLSYNDTVFDANNPHDDSEVPSLQLPAPITSIIWNVTDWSTDSLDNDANGLTDDSAENGMRQVDVTVNYRVGSASKQLTVTFMKVSLL